MEASAKIITGFTNSRHITQIYESLIWDSLFGSANRVLTHGSSLAIDVLPKKGVVKVLDGLFIFSKRLGVVEKSDSVTFTPMLSDSLYCKIGVAIQYTRASQSQGGQESFALVGSASSSFTSKTQAENYVVPYNGSTSYNTTITTSSTSTYKAYFPLYEVVVNASSVVSSRQLFEKLPGVAELESSIYTNLGPVFLESFNLRRAERERTISQQESKDIKRVSDQNVETSLISQRQAADTQIQSKIEEYIPSKSKSKGDSSVVWIGPDPSIYGNAFYYAVISGTNANSIDNTSTMSSGSSFAVDPIVVTENETYQVAWVATETKQYDFVRFGNGEYLVFRHDGILDANRVIGTNLHIIEPDYLTYYHRKHVYIKTKGGTS